MKLFIDAYGAEAGNLALKLLPYGGLYIAGGVAARNATLIKEGGFLSAFLAKGRMSSLLRRIPVYLVLDRKVGLLGAASRARRA
jgi:glucokinase